MLWCPHPFALVPAATSPASSPHPSRPPHPPTPTHPAPPSLPLPAGAWLDGVEQSLLYCTSHALSPQTGQAAFTVRRPPNRKTPLRYDLIEAGLFRGALLHYARQFRHLESSRRLLEEVGRWVG